MEDDETPTEDLESHEKGSAPDSPAMPADAVPTKTAGAADFAGEPANSLPSHIGQYRILGKLGEGGMGVVYEAEQRHPRRRVNVKIVRGGQFVDEHRVRLFHLST